MAVKHTLDGKTTNENNGQKVSFCGKLLYNHDWFFGDIDHLNNSVGGSQQPCKKCIKKIIRNLQKELS